MEVATYTWKVLAAWIAVIIGISTSTEDILSLHRRGQNVWQRYGAVFVLVLRGAVESYYQIEHVLEGDNESLHGYQDSLIMECNMIAVAAAIVSSVCITTYGFPSLPEMHWAVTAAFTFSLIASLFCVYGACTLQRRISNISNVSQFRIWLSAPQDVTAALNNGLSEPELPRANVATVLTMTAPKTLLDHSIRFFLLGLIGYLVLLHSLAVRGSQFGSDDSTIILAPTSVSVTGSRNVIIVCAFSLCVGISLLISPSSYKNFKLAISPQAGFGDGIMNGMVRDKPTTPRETLLPPEKAFVRGLYENPVNATARHANGDGGADATGLLQALRDAALAHERSAAAARESARADEKVAEAYLKLLHAR